VSITIDRAGASLHESPANEKDAIETSPQSASGRRIFWALIRLAVGVALIVYLAHSRIIDFRALSKLATEWPISLAGIGIIFIDIVLMAVRLSWLFRARGLYLPIANSLELTLVSSFFATFLPGAAGGDLAKLYYAAKENKGRRAEIVTVAIFDRAIGLFSVLLLPLLFAPLFPDLLRNVAALRVLLLISGVLALCMVGGFLICVLAPPFVNRVAASTFRILRGGELAQRMAATVAGYRHASGAIIGAVGLSVLANLSLIAATAIAILALHPASMSMKMCLVIPLGDLANNLPVTPGGLGVGESAYNALFKLAGLEGGAEALLAWRIWRAAVGLIGLALYLRGPGRAVYDTQKADKAEKPR